MRAMTAKARTGCQLCRIKHLKCDQASPTCGRCAASGSECLRGFTYRFQRETFANDQKWIATPNDLTFVDETKGLSSNSDYESEYATPPPEARSTDLTSDFSTPTTDAFPRSEPHSVLPVAESVEHGLVDSNHSPCLISALKNPFNLLLWNQGPEGTPELSNESLPLETSSNPLTIDGILNKSAAEPFDEDLSQAFDQSKDSSIPPIYSAKPIWPLSDAAEAKLLRHFVQNLATWLDLCDPKNHFQVEVPQRAGSCRILLNAIFALSSRHMSRTGNYDPLASNRYHDECLKYLNPMLSDAATVSDESLFAATIILRVMEEMDAIELDSQCHRLGIQVFVSARDPMSGGLSEAAFWVGLRQEIYSAMMKHQSTQLNLEHCTIDHSLGPTDDYGWANRAIIHCADVLNCCFGEAGVSSRRWEELKLYGEQWEEAKPASFTPVYYRAPDRQRREAFPEIWYNHGSYIISVQHFLLAKILLAIFNPKLPRIGGTRNAAIRLMESQVQSYLRDLCGIGLSNLETAPGIFTASMGIAICGDRMTDEIDQEALMDILERTEKDHARPTKAVRLQMREAWGWPPEL